MKSKTLKFIVAAGVLTMSASIANAQKFHIGVKAGANIYKNSGNDLSNKYNGFPFGGAYIGFSGEKLGLTVEGLFTQTRMITGNTFSQVFNGYIQNGKNQIQHAEFSFSELSIPVLVGIKLLPRLWFEIGPQFTKIVNMQDKDDVLTELGNVHKDSYISGAAGLKLKLPLGLHVSGRFVQGLSNRNNTSVSERWTTQHFQLGVGFGF